MKKKLVNPKNVNKAEEIKLTPQESEKNEAAAAEPVGDGAAASRDKKGHRKPASVKKPVKAGKMSGLSIFLVIFVAVLMLAFMGISFGGYKLSHSPYILPNVYANGVNVGGMTVEQARQLLEQAGFDETAEGRLRVKMPMGANFKLLYSESGARLGSQSAADIAFDYGHSGNWYADFFKYVSNIMMPVDIVYFDKTLNYDYINAAMDEAIARFNERASDAEIDIDLENGWLSLLKGAGELEIDKQALYRQIVDGLLAERESITYTLPETKLTKPDFEAVAEEINTEPENANFDENFEIKPSVTGVHLNAAEAGQMWTEAKAGSRVVIPITITPPEISTEALRDMLFRDKLGSQTTYFTGSSENRINNIRLVSDKLDGLILMPGDEFSFNGYIGERTKEKGFKPAGAYLNGYVVEEVGGGICQVSSTLYCATMLAQLETVERVCHYFAVNYLSPGLDATVSWPDTDFKFRNCRDYPVKIRSYCDEAEKALTIEIWGTDMDGSYVELRYGVGVFYDEEFTDVIIGTTAVSYRAIFDRDGNQIDYVKESHSAYYLHDWEIQWPEPEEEEVPTEPEGGEGTDPGTGGTDPGTGGTDPGTGGTDPGAGGTDPGTGDNSGSGMEDEDGNINFG